MHTLASTMHNNNNINILASRVHARSITNSSSSSILARVCILLVSTTIVLDEVLLEYKRVCILYA